MYCASIVQISTERQFCIAAGPMRCRLCPITILFVVLALPRASSRIRTGGSPQKPKVEKLPQWQGPHCRVKVAVQNTVYRACLLGSLARGRIHHQLMEGS